MKEFPKNELGFCAFEFYNEEGARTLPDWDTSLYVELRDSSNILRHTVTIDSSPALEQESDDQGLFVKINGINLSEYSLGVVTAYVYAKINDLEVGGYPFQLSVFTITASTSTVSGGYSSNSLILNIRNFMRDKPEVNRLISGHETLDETILTCIEAACDEWNATPPMGLSTISITSSGTDINGNELKIIRIPTNIKWLFLEKTMVKILQSVLLLRGRNTLSYSDNGISVADEQGPFNAQMQMLQIMTQDVETRLLRYKTAMNLNQLLDIEGGAGSDYSYFIDWWPNSSYVRGT